MSERPALFRLPEGGTLRDPIVIVGAGLAGCWLAWELSRRGRTSTLIDAGDGVASAASGNRHAVFRPFLTRDDSPTSAFYRHAARYLHQALGLLDIGAPVVQRCGVLQLLERPYPPRPDYHCLDADETSERAGTALPAAAIEYPDAGWLDAASLCRRLLAVSAARLLSGSRVISLDRGTATRWSVARADGSALPADTVLLAAGTGLIDLPQTRHLPIVPARGQTSSVSLAGNQASLRCVITGRRSVIPLGNRLVVGSSYTRHDASRVLRADDRAANIEALKCLLPHLSLQAAASDLPATDWAEVRATTPDRLPLLGPLPDWNHCRSVFAHLSRGRRRIPAPLVPIVPGLHLCGGFGSRGAISIPWSAHSLVTWLLGEADAHQRSTLCELQAVRFLLRELRRSG